MAQTAKIEQEQFTRLWNEGMKSKDIAIVFNVSPASVSGAARRFGLKMRNCPNDEPEKASEDKTEEPLRSPLDPRPNFPEARDLALIESEGRYARISELAREWSLPMSTVQARWHRLRTALKTIKKPTVRKVGA